jgi:hypothetical protein
MECNMKEVCLRKVLGKARLTAREIRPRALKTPGGDRYDPYY